MRQAIAPNDENGASEEEIRLLVNDTASYHTSSSSEISVIFANPLQEQSKEILSEARPDAVPDKDEEQKGIASIPSSVFNLANTVIGAGVVSLPYAFSISGLLLGFFFLILVYCLSIISILFIIRTIKLCGGPGVKYRDIAEAACGKFGVIMTDVFLIASCFGSLCSYLIVISDMIGPLIAFWRGKEEEDVRRNAILVLSAIFLVPLSSLRYLNMLRHTSLLGLISIVYLIFVVIFRAGESIADHPSWKCNDNGCVSFGNFSFDFFRTIPIMCFAFSCQMNVFTIFSELKDPTPERMRSVGLWALTLSASAYGIVGVFGYLTFFSNVEGNILLNYDLDDPLIILARMALALVVFFCFPLLAHPLINSVEGLFFRHKEYSLVRRVSLAVISIFCALLISILIDDVSFMFGLTGATADTSICFILPPVFFIILDASHITSRNKIIAVILLCFGVVFMIASTTITIAEEVQSHHGNETLVNGTFFTGNHKRLVVF